MAEIKLIATDLDGTFLKGGHTPHPENIRAVRACQEAGLEYAPVRGETGRNAEKLWKRSGLTTFVR